MARLAVSQLTNAQEKRKRSGEMQSGAAMEALDRDRHGAVGALLHGLPDELVLANIITRLPWHDRPVCRVVSKAWKACIDAATICPQIRSQSRAHLLPLLQGHFVFSMTRGEIFITKGGRQPQRWRKIPRCTLGWIASMGVEASCGVLYAWALKPHPGFVLKMDMAAGDWAWSSTASVPPSANYRALLSKVPQFSTHGGSPGPSKDDEAAEQTKMLRASPEGAQQEELYSLVKGVTSPHTTEMEMLVYDACHDSWRTKQLIPSPQLDSSHRGALYLVNADCFQPAPDGGINIVRINLDGSLFWFNSFLREGWIRFDCHIPCEDRSRAVNMYVLHGQLYGLFPNPGKEKKKKDKLYQLHLNLSEDTSEIHLNLLEVTSEIPLQRNKWVLKEAKMVVETTEARWKNARFSFEIGDWRSTVAHVTMM